MMRELRARRKNEGLVEFRKWVTVKEKKALGKKLDEIRAK